MQTVRGRTKTIWHRSVLIGLAILLVVISAKMAQASIVQPINDDTHNQTVDVAAQACRAGQFDTFFRLYVQSPMVRERFTADPVWSVPAAGRAGFVSRSEILARFPLAFHGWNYAIVGTPPAGADKQYVLLRTRHVSRTVWRVDWMEARFDTPSPGGKWIAVPVYLTGVPKRFTFVATDDACWHLTDEVTAPTDTPFEPGIQILRCAARAADFQRELRRIEQKLDGHPDDMETARGLAACAELESVIEAAVAADAELRGLREKIKRRLAALGMRQSPAARAALGLDEQRVRRSLMRNQNLPMDGLASSRDLRDDLAVRLTARLEILDRTEPKRSGFAGIWRNVGGQIDIRRLGGGSYEVNASVVDPEFFAWSCEFDEAMPRSGNTLSLTYPLGDSIRLTLRDGILIVGQDDAGSGYCGAGGSLKGTYFPIRPRKELPPQRPIP